MVFLPLLCLFILPLSLLLSLSVPSFLYILSAPAVSWAGWYSCHWVELDMETEGGRLNQRNRYQQVEWATKHWDCHTHAWWSPLIKYFIAVLKHSNSNIVSSIWSVPHWELWCSYFYFSQCFYFAFYSFCHVCVLPATWRKCEKCI